MLFKGIKVEYICPVVYIKDKAVEGWKENERYVLNKVVELGFSNFDVENPIDDLVYIQFSNKDWEVETELLSKIYGELSRVFDEVKINLYLDDFIDGIGNSVDLTLEEFLNLLELEDLKKQTIEIFKSYPDKIGTQILQKRLKIGIIKANKLIEALENDGAISKRNEDGKRKLLNI